MARKPFVVDLVSYFYPERDLTADSLRQLTKEHTKSQDNNIFVFSADEKVAAKYRDQLKRNLPKVRAAVGIPIRCFFKVDPDVSQKSLKESLNKRIGWGKVTDKQIARAARAWNDPTDR
jgi:hypothetical protein